MQLNAYRGWTNDSQALKAMATGRGYLSQFYRQLIIALTPSAASHVGKYSCYGRVFTKPWGPDGEIVALFL